MLPKTQGTQSMGNGASMRDGEAGRQTTLFDQDGAPASDMQRIVDSGGLLLWVGATVGTRRWVGKALSLFTGRAEQDLVGQPWTELVHPEDQDRCSAIDLVCMASDRNYSLEYRLRRHDGRYRWMLDCATASRDSSGRFDGHVGVCIDIHERRLVEDKLAERLRKMRVTPRR